MISNFGAVPTEMYSSNFFIESKYIICKLSKLLKIAESQTQKKPRKEKKATKNSKPQSSSLF